MSDANMREDLPDNSDDLLAAEFVLGVLPAEQQALLTRKRETDQAFALLVNQWEERMGAMADAFEPVTPPSAVKDALDTRLFGRANKSPSFWTRVGLWQALTGLATAAFLIVALLPALQPTPQSRHLAASLSAKDSGVTYLVLYDAAEKKINLAHVEGNPGDGRDFELWIAEGSDAPISLGVIPAGESTEVAVSEQARAILTNAAHMAISLEPRGGSPTGQPTGPVLALGDLHDM